MKTWRSWPWTIALAAVLAGFVLLGVIGLGLRTSPGEVLVSVVVTLAALAGLLRVLTMGVRATPSGLIIRDLTRTTRVLWTQVRRVSCAQTDRRGVHAPVLQLAAPLAGQGAKAVKASAAGAANSGKSGPGGKGGAARGARRGTGRPAEIEITVLGSYKRVVAQRRADQIEAARLGATPRTR